MSMALAETEANTTSHQEYCLERFRKFIDTIQENSSTPSPLDSKGLKLTAFALYLDCRREGVGDRANRMLQEEFKLDQTLTRDQSAKLRMFDYLISRLPEISRENQPTPRKLVGIR